MCIRDSHIGAIPYILKQVNVPIFATQLTAGLIESKLEEHKMLDKVSINIVKQGDIVKLDKLKVEFIRTNPVSYTHLDVYKRQSI